jgi:hypothetical protein
VSTYSGAEMLKLLQIHLYHNVIDRDTAHAMTGALTYKVRRTHDDDNSVTLYSATGQERIIENLIRPCLSNGTTTTAMMTTFLLLELFRQGHHDATREDLHARRG